MILLSSKSRLDSTVRSSNGDRCIFCAPNRIIHLFHSLINMIHESCDNVIEITNLSCSFLPKTIEILDGIINLCIFGTFSHYRERKWEHQCYSLELYESFDLGKLTIREYLYSSYRLSSLKRYSYLLMSITCVFIQTD